MTNPIDKTAKLQNNKDWFFDKYITEQWTVKDISEALNISYKLVLMKIEEYGFNKL
jgi:hypothetical protein